MRDSNRLKIDININNDQIHLDDNLMAKVVEPLDNNLITN